MNLGYELVIAKFSWTILFESTHNTDFNKKECNIY